MDINKRKQIQRIFLFFAALLLLVKLVRDQGSDLILNQVTGTTMGTISYQVKYKASENLNYQIEIDSLLYAFNQSLSTYVSNSEISRLNRSGNFVFESPFFYPVLLASKEIHQITKGAFDPTVGTLINAYGFGPDTEPQELNDALIDSLLQFVGFSKIDFDSHQITMPTGAYLDLSAVAKGYAVDLVADYLKSKSITDWMVEIGGEVNAHGTNEKNEAWAIGIVDPLSKMNEQKTFAIARLNNRSLATSGNYRIFYQKEDKIYAHIIDPRTGRAGDHNILSASVFASNCMIADALATAFMVMGIDEAMKILEKDDLLDAILIYQGPQEIEYFVTDGIRETVRVTPD